MFWEDYYIKNPTETRRSESGEVIFDNTGDPLIDKWEREIERGLTPDLYEELDPKVREKNNKSVEIAQKEIFDLERNLSAEGFTDDYTKDT